MEYSIITIGLSNGSLPVYFQTIAQLRLNIWE